jgi:hypothetical protein
MTPNFQVHMPVLLFNSTLNRLLSPALLAKNSSRVCRYNKVALDNKEIKAAVVSHNYK